MVSNKIVSHKSFIIQLVFSGIFKGGSTIQIPHPHAAIKLSKRKEKTIMLGLMWSVKV